MPNNISLAALLLHLLKKRLEKNQEPTRKYFEGINKVILKGYTEKISKDDNTRGVWYLPHHAVINEYKRDKICIIFGCAANIRGLSLNNFVLQGPD